MQSLNNKFILESYKEDRSIKANVANGFAMIAQKTQLKGLKSLVDFKSSDGTIFPKGSTVYIREQLLQAQPWAKQVFTSDAIGEEFIIVDMQYCEFVV
jgi:hypothetical protein